jgi:hypothetical protein
MPPSSRRATRSPAFLVGVPAKRVHALFPVSPDAAEPLFGGGGGGGRHGDGDGDQALGVESLAPPLPPPSSQMTEEAAERLGRAIEVLRRTADRLGAELAANALEIGCLVARKILDAELKGDAALRASLVRSAVRRLGDVHKVTIHLSPADREAVESASGEASSNGLGIAKVELLTDTNLTPGDCIVESDAAMVDGRLGTRLEELRRVLIAAMNDSGRTSS